MAALFSKPVPQNCFYIRGIAKPQSGMDMGDWKKAEKSADEVAFEDRHRYGESALGLAQCLRQL